MRRGWISLAPATYASVQGRFTSVDEFNPILGKQGAGDKEEAEKEFRQWLLQPARWNRYPHCLNNPISCIDPDGMDPITVNLNIIYDENSNYTEEEKKRIRQTYIEQAQKRFGTVDIKFNITETAGRAINLGNEYRQTIATGAVEGAVNVFFTTRDVGLSSEVTRYQKSDIFISTSTSEGADPSDLTHGLIHVFGVSTGNGYSSIGAEARTIAAHIRLVTGPIFYSDDRSPRREIVPGFVSAKVEPVYRTVRYERTIFDVIRDGARKYIKK